MKNIFAAFRAKLQVALPNALQWAKYTGVMGLSMLISGQVRADNGVFAWDNTLCMVAKDLSGATASAVAVIVCVVTGLMLAIGEANGWFKTLIGICFGLSLAFGATQLIPSIVPTGTFRAC